MSGLRIPAADAERLLTFEVESAVYALPIAEVHEVAEAQRICCVPTISRNLVGIMNWHGDALPVVSAPLLLQVREEDLPLEPEAGAEADPDREPGMDEDLERTGQPAAETRPRPEAGMRSLVGQHVLVVSGRDDEAAQLGIPIDRVIGLVDGARRRRGGGRLVVERRSVDGRVVSVLDPRRLVTRASEVIARVA